MARFHLPHFDGVAEFLPLVVRRGGSQALPVGTEGHAVSATAEPAEASQQRAGPYVKEADPRTARHREGRTVGAHGHPVGLAVSHAPPREEELTIPKYGRQFRRGLRRIA